MKHSSRGQDSLQHANESWKNTYNSWKERNMDYARSHTLNSRHSYYLNYFSKWIMLVIQALVFYPSDGLRLCLLGPYFCAVKDLKEQKSYRSSLLCPPCRGIRLPLLADMHLCKWHQQLQLSDFYILLKSYTQSRACHKRLYLGTLYYVRSFTHCKAG